MALWAISFVLSVILSEFELHLHFLLTRLLDLGQIAHFYSRVIQKTFIFFKLLNSYNIGNYIRVTILA